MKGFHNQYVIERASALAVIDAPAHRSRHFVLLFLIV